MLIFKDQKGFSLIEVAVAATVLVIAILTTAFSLFNIQNLGELSREKVIAVQDANRVLEAMRDTADTSLSNLQSTDWTVWATNNVINGKGTDEIQLDQENVTAAFSGTNPVQVALTLSWRHRQRTFSYRVITLMTDRG